MSRFVSGGDYLRWKDLPLLYGLYDGREKGRRRESRVVGFGVQERMETGDKYERRQPLERGVETVLKT